jgi:tetratricopeptide (TPR) repeat protein
MLNDEDVRAVDVARETLRMIEEVGGSDEIQAQALNVLGTSRTKLGDRDGLKDLEQSIVITQPGSYERLRGFINLASTVSELGELQWSFDLHEEGLREAERFGSVRSQSWLEAEISVDDLYRGRWDEALARIEGFIQDVEAGKPHYMEAAVRDARALVRLGRGDVAGALADSEYVLSLTREVKDPQIVHPALAIQSRILLEAGRRAEASRYADELLAMLALGKTGFISFWGVGFAFVLTGLGRAEELEPAIGSRTVTRWQTAALAYAAGRIEESADLLDEMGAVVDAAYARMRAAEACAAEGRRPEADAQLQRALAVFREIGATAYVNEAESLFAASA